MFDLVSKCGFKIENSHLVGYLLYYYPQTQLMYHFDVKVFFNMSIDYNQEFLLENFEDNARITSIEIIDKDRKNVTSIF